MSVSLSFVVLITGLGATTPNPRGFTAIALVGTPIAVVLTGMLEFIILNGTDAFPVLAIAVAPFTIGAALLMKSQNLPWSSLGRVNLLFMMVILASSNPQTYNPQVFLFTSLFSVAAAAQRQLRRGCPTSILSTPGYVWRNACRSGSRSTTCRPACRWCPA